MNICAYATLEDTKEYLAGTPEAKVSDKDDNRLKKFCLEMSRKFDQHCDRHFYPIFDTRLFDHPCGDNTALRLIDSDLLAASSIATSNGSTVIGSDDYWLMNGDNMNWSWYDRVKLKPGGTVTAFSYSGAPEGANAVTGLWGRHDDYESAWASVDTVQATIAAGASEVTVGSIEGVDDLGLAPRFKTLQLIRFGTGVTAEMALVIGKDTAAEQLTLRRGVNGTTAVEQAEGTVIYIYRPMAELQHAMEVLTTWAYRRKDIVGRDIDQPIASASGVVILPQRLPGEVKEILKEFKRHNFAY